MSILPSIVKGRVKEMYLSKRDQYKRKPSGKISIAEALNDSFTGYSGLDSFADVHPFHQTLRFKRSVAKLKEKANEVCEIYPTMPKPGVRSKIDEDSLFIEIPLLSTHDDILKGISIEDGTLDITFEEGVHFKECKVILEKSDALTDEDIEALLEVYKRSYINSLKPTRYMSTENIGKMFSKNISVESLIEKSSTIALAEALQEKGCSVYIPTESSTLSWNNLAGYDKVKRIIEDSVLFTLTHPDVFKEIINNTRVDFESNKPK